MKKNNTKKERVYVCYKVIIEVAILNFGTYHEKLGYRYIRSG